MRLSKDIDGGTFAFLNKNFLRIVRIVDKIDTTFFIADPSMLCRMGKMVEREWSLLADRRLGRFQAKLGGCGERLHRRSRDYHLDCEEPITAWSASDDIG